MKIRDIASIITPITFLIAFCSFSVWKSDQEVAQREAAMTKAAHEGRVWMNDTTAKLEATLAGIESITGETVVLAQQIESLADRLTILETVQ